MSTLRTIAVRAALAVAGVFVLVVVARAVTGEAPTEVRPDDRAGAASAPRGRFAAALTDPTLVGGHAVIEPAGREVRVGAELRGRVARVLVREGQFVLGGAPLVELESETQRAAVATAEAEHAHAAAELARVRAGLRPEEVSVAASEARAARAQAELAADTLARRTPLAERGALPAEELTRARRQATTQSALHRAAEARARAARAGARDEDVAVAEARVATASARVEQARVEVARRTVRAPQDGEILEIKLRPGELYDPMSGEPILVLGDTRRLFARMDVDERDVARLGLGARAYVEVDAYVGTRFEGRVVDIARRMGRKNVRTDDPVERIDTKIREVVIALDGAPPLVPGQRGTAFLLAAEPPAAGPQTVARAEPDLGQE